MNVTCIVTGGYNVTSAEQVDLIYQDALGEIITHSGTNAHSMAHGQFLTAVFEITLARKSEVKCRMDTSALAAIKPEYYGKYYSVSLLSGKGASG